MITKIQTHTHRYTLSHPLTLVFRSTEESSVTSPTCTSDEESLASLGRKSYNE